NFSLEVWANPRGDGVMLGKEGEYLLARWSRVLSYCLANSSPGWGWYSTGVPLPLNVWTHVLLVYTNGVILSYTNGNLAHIYNGSGSLGDVVPAANELWLGGRQGAVEYFSGLLDEVSIYRRALPSNEVQVLYASGAAGKCYTDEPAPRFVVAPYPDRQSALEQRRVAFGGMAVGTPRPTYQWLFNGNPLAGATNNNLLLTNLTLAQAGGYALIASNPF